MATQHQMRACALLAPLFVIALCSGVHHVPLGRNAVPVSRVFSHAHRPWARLAMERAPPAQRGVISRHLRTHARIGGTVNGMAVEQLFGGVTTVGEYYVEVMFGGQPVRVQIDTGSSTLAVPLAECENCRKHDQRFNLRHAVGSASVIRCDSPACRRSSCGMFPECNVCSPSSRACCSMALPRSCGFFLRYADNSGAQGALVQAEVTLAGFRTPLVFGGILRQVQNFETSEVDGILGLSYKTLACNPTCVEPLFDTLVETGKVERDVFSICTGKVGGTLTLGGSNPDQYEGELQYAPMGKMNYFYDVDISSFYVGKHHLNLPRFTNGIVDSGTTLVVMTTSSYVALKRFFQSRYCHVPALCPRHRRHHESSVRVLYKNSAGELNAFKNITHEYYDDDILNDNTWFSPAACAALPQRYVDMLPDLTIVLAGGVRLTMEPDDYMMQVEVRDHWMPWAKPTVYRCLGIQPLAGMDRMPNNVILGDTLLQKYYYEIDREKNRVGFAPSKNCVLSQETLSALRSQTPPDLVPDAVKRSSAWDGVLRCLGVLLLFAAILTVNYLRKPREGYSRIAS